MKHIIIVFLSFITCYLNGQQAVTITGGFASGSGRNASYSAGQVA